MLDAYTVRKAVPRILLAVIGINLSIYVCLALLDLSTIVGRGIDQLFMSTFRDAGAFAVVSPNSSFGSIGGLLALGGGSIWALSGALGGLIALIPLIGFLALAIMFTLIITQALIIFLTIVSPVAIACFILPGTEKYFQKWLDLFTKALLVYPIIFSILAMSKVMASILIGTAVSSPGTISGAKIFAAILVIYAPLALIPFAFKLSGGLIGAVAGFAVGQASKSGQASRKKTLENPESFASKLQRRTDSFKMNSGLTGGQIIKGTGAAVRSGVRNRSLRGAGGAYRTAAQQRQQREIDSVAGDLARLPGWNYLKDNDDGLRALTYDNENEARQALQARGWNATRVDNAVAAARASGAAFGDRSIQYNAAKAMVATGTSFDHMQDQVETLARVSHGNTSTASSLAGFANATNKQVGRWDLAPSYGTLNELTQASVAGNAPSQAQYDMATMQAVRESTDAGTFARTAKPRALENIGDVMARVNMPHSEHSPYTLAERQQLQAQVRASAVEFGENRYAMNQASADFADAIREEVSGQHGIPLEAAAPDRMGADQTGRARTYGGNLTEAQRLEQERRAQEARDQQNQQREG